LKTRRIFVVILYYVDPKRGRAWQEQMRQVLPQVEFRVWPEHGDLTEVTALVVWTFEASLLTQLPNLEVIFTISAGVDQIPLAAIPPDIQIVRTVSTDLAEQMAEYACLSVLMIQRRTLDYMAARRSRQWRRLPTQPAAQIRVGVMGLGEQGRSVLSAMQTFHYQLLGWARSRHCIEGVACYAGETELHEFLAATNILICLLPLTEATRHILNRNLFDQLPVGASVINMGRGEHLVAQDLLDALDHGHLSQAVLDVAHPEPLPDSDPLWTHPRVILTPHIAGATRRNAGFECLVQNLTQWLNQEPPAGLIDRNRGY
jgi:glyoxylate/hydroxypyruvate reductase A